MSTILITGSSSGIGAAAAGKLARAGHRVLLTGRSAAKLARVRAAIVAGCPPGVIVPPPIAADLSRLAGVRRLASAVLDQEGRLDVLVNNAAVQPRKRLMSGDGVELGFAVNHLAHQALAMLLADLLARSGGRVIVTASDEHAAGVIDFADLPMERGWHWRASYARSKLANILFTGEFSRRYGIPATSFHPGSVSTDLNRDLFLARLTRPIERRVLKSPGEGAATLTWLAEAAEGGAPRAVYYIDRAPARTAPAATDVALAGRLWDVSADLIASEGAR